MALAEAYFYLGQHYLVAGDRTKAQESFEKTRSLGVINYLEHTSAGFELERLRKPSMATAVKPSTATVAKPNPAAPPKPNPAAPSPKPSTLTSAKPPSTPRAVTQ